MSFILLTIEFYTASGVQVKLKRFGRISLSGRRRPRQLSCPELPMGDPVEPRLQHIDGAPHVGAEETGSNL